LRSPVVFRWLIGIASLAVPSGARRKWRTKWLSGLENWWILVQRGELVPDSDHGFAHLFRHAFADAIWIRFHRQSWRMFVRGPAFVMVVWGAVMLLLGAISRGFAMTRTLVGMANGSILTDPRWQAGETVLTHVVPVVIAAIIAGILVFIRRPAFQGYTWRGWLFLLCKTAAVAVTVSLLWVEFAELFRGWVPRSEIRLIITGVVFRAIFIAAFSCAVLWSFLDQRQRCPVCLHRLAMPVRIGSSASVFEPVTTELLCEQGHGLLCITEFGGGEDDHWTALDESWQELFSEKV
jgi:hypothetical protein